MGDHNHLNNEEVVFLFGVPLSSEIDLVEITIPNVEENAFIPLQQSGKN